MNPLERFPQLCPYMNFESWKKILLKMYLYLFVCVREDSMRIMSLPLRYESRNKTQVVRLGSK